MVIEHIAIFTNNTEVLKNFYVKYFNGKAGVKYYNIETGLKSFFITFETGARLEIMQRPDINIERFPNCKGLNHLAFKTGSAEKVDSLTKLIKDDGYRIRSNPRETGDGYYESCIYDPDGNEVEITA